MYDRFGGRKQTNALLFIVIVLGLSYWPPPSADVWQLLTIIGSVLGVTAVAHAIQDHGNHSIRDSSDVDRGQGD